MLQPMELLFKLKLIYQKLVKTIAPQMQLFKKIKTLNSKSWEKEEGKRAGLWMRRREKGRGKA